MKSIFKNSHIVLAFGIIITNLGAVRDEDKKTNFQEVSSMEIGFQENGTRKISEYK